MEDLLEQSLREALLERAAQLDPEAIARLRAVDYRLRARPRRLPAFGALAVGGAAAAATAVIALGAGTEPAFAGWRSTPTTPSAGQLAQAQQTCGAGLGSPVLTDTRGPYTVSIYGDASSSDVCLAGSGVSASWSSSTSNPAGLSPAQIELRGSGIQDAGGNSLTLVDGRVGSGVTAVTIDRADGSSVQATVENGWYLAWWPGTVAASTAQITTATGTSSETFPAGPSQAPRPACPAGSHCATGYSFGSSAGSVAGGGSASSTVSGAGAGASPSQP